MSSSDPRNPRKRKERTYEVSMFVDAIDRDIVSHFLWYRKRIRITRANQDQHIYQSHVTKKNRKYLPESMQSLQTILLHRLIAIRAGIALSSESVGFKYHKKTSNYHRSNLMVSTRKIIRRELQPVDEIISLKKLTKRQRQRWDALTQRFPDLLNYAIIETEEKEISEILECRSSAVKKTLHFLNKKIGNKLVITYAHDNVKYIRNRKIVMRIVVL